MADYWNAPALQGIDPAQAMSRINLPETSQAANILMQIAAQRNAQRQQAQQQFTQGLAGFMQQRQRDQIANSLLAQMQAPAPLPQQQAAAAPTDGGAGAGYPAGTLAVGPGYTGTPVGSDVSDVAPTASTTGALASWGPTGAMQPSVAPSAAPAAAAPTGGFTGLLARYGFGPGAAPNLGGEAALNMQLGLAQKLAQIDYLQGRGQYYQGRGQGYGQPPITDPNTGFVFTGGRWVKPMAGPRGSTTGIDPATESAITSVTGLTPKQFESVPIDQAYINDDKTPRAVKYVDGNNNVVDGPTAAKDPDNYFAVGSGLGAYGKPIPFRTTVTQWNNLVNTYKNRPQLGAGGTAGTAPPAGGLNMQAYAIKQAVAAGTMSRQDAITRLQALGLQ